MIETTKNLERLADELRSYATAETILMTSLRRGGLDIEQQREVCNAIKKLQEN